MRIAEAAADDAVAVLLVDKTLGSIISSLVRFMSVFPACSTPAFRSPSLVSCAAHSLHSLPTAEFAEGSTPSGNIGVELSRRCEKDVQVRCTVFSKILRAQFGAVQAGNLVDLVIGDIVYVQIKHPDDATDRFCADVYCRKFSQTCRLCCIGPKS